MKTIEQRIRTVLSELEDIAESAEDCAADTEVRRWLGVTHKTQEAMGAMNNALEAAKQAEAESGF